MNLPQQGVNYKQYSCKDSIHSKQILIDYEGNGTNYHLLGDLLIKGH